MTISLAMLAGEDKANIAAFRHAVMHGKAPTTDISEVADAYGEWKVSLWTGDKVARISPLAAECLAQYCGSNNRFDGLSREYQADVRKFINALLVTARVARDRNSMRHVGPE